MNEEEKESIEEFRKQLRLAINIDDVTTVIRNDYAQTILNLIEKLQKENEEQKAEIERRKHDNKTLKEFVSAVFNEELNDKYTIHLTDKQYNAVIENAQNDTNQKWIQKVKDKIEELKAQYKTALEENSTEAFILKCQITILQELIEEREEK